MEAKSMHQHNYFVDRNGFICCHQCENKWKIKPRVGIIVFIALVVPGLIITILGLSLRLLWLASAGVLLASVSRSDSFITRDILATGWFDLEKCKGDQVKFDYHTDRELQRIQMLEEFYEREHSKKQTEKTPAAQEKQAPDDERP